MKKIAIVLLLPLLLSGCGAEQTLETVADRIPAQPVLAPPAQISVRLPDNAVAPVLESDTEQLYFSEDYEISIETRLFHIFVARKFLSRLRPWNFPKAMPIFTKRILRTLKVSMRQNVLLKLPRPVSITFFS